VPPVLGVAGDGSGSSADGGEERRVMSSLVVMDPAVQVAPEAPNMIRTFAQMERKWNELG